MLSTHACLVEERRHSLPVRRGGAGLGEVIKESQCVSLATAELGGEIVDCRGFDFDAGEPPDHAAAKLTKA